MGLGPRGHKKVDIFSGVLINPREWMMEDGFTLYRGELVLLRNIRIFSWGYFSARISNLGGRRSLVFGESEIGNTSHVRRPLI